MAVIDFGGTKETVVTRKEFSLAKARKVLKKETIAIIGYGVQGPAQALNLRDNGFNVIIGQSKKFMKDWNRAKRDGFVVGETLFEIEEAVSKATVVQYLLPAPLRKLRRTLRPEPFGATRITSTFSGAIILVRSL